MKFDLDFMEDVNQTKNRTQSMRYLSHLSIKPPSRSEGNKYRMASPTSASYRPPSVINRDSKDSSPTLVYTNPI